MWYHSKGSQNVRMLSPLKRRHPAYVTLLVKSPFCPRCWKNLPHIVHHIYFWTTTCKHIIALPVFIGNPTSFRNGFNHTLHIEPIKRLLQAKHSGNNQNLSWWSRFKRISIRQNQAWQKRKQNTDKSITNKDTNKRRIIVNIAKGTTDPRVEFILPKSYCKFKHKSWSNFIFRILTRHQLEISTKHQHLH